MIENGSSDVLIQDSWQALPEQVRDELLTRRVALTAPGAFPYQDLSKRWIPLRPLILDEPAYHLLEAVVARVLTLAVQSCQRRASTLGELHQALRFRDELPLMDPDGPLVASELTACARPDILIEQGRPRIVELNVGTRIGGGTNAPRMAAGFAGLIPDAGLCPPRSTVTARTEAMLRALGGQLGNSEPHRVAIPAYWTVDDAGTRTHNKTVKKLILADARRVGFEVVRTDLDQLRLDAAGRLLAADVPIDLVLIQWGCGEYRHIVDGDGGLAALRSADRAGTVEVFPRTESALINSKVILAWLHEDCEADLVTPADQALVRNYVPRTTALGLNRSSSAAAVPPALHGERDHMVVKPSVGKAGNGVRFGSQTSQQDWCSAVADAAQHAPVVLQQRVTPDRVTMPFLDQESGQQASASVPFLLSPFLVDGAAADVSVRHMLPDVPTGDVVIAVDRGGCWNTVVLRADRPAPLPARSAQ